MVETINENRRKVSLTLGILDGVSLKTQKKKKKNVQNIFKHFSFHLKRAIILNRNNIQTSPENATVVPKIKLI